MRLTMIAGMSALILVSGCTGLTEKVRNRFDDGESKASRLMKDVGRAESGPRNAAPVVHDNGVWVAKNVIKLNQGDILPPIFSEQTTFDRTVHSLAELAERITVRSGVPTKVAPDALSAAQRALNPSAALGLSGAAGNGLGVSPQPGAVTPFNGQQMQQNQTVRIVYPAGTLKGLLDTVAARFGVFWKYTNGTIHFYYTDSRTFQVNAIPGDSAVTATVASGSNSGGGGGTGQQSTTSSSNAQNTAVRSQLSVFGSIEKSVQAMLSPFGKVVASPATGSITVVDTPETLERVANFIDSENKSLSRQVMINVTVLAVNLSDSDSMGINWNLVYGDLTRKFGVQNVTAVEPNSNSFSAGILNTSGSRFSGSSLVINALAAQGQVRRETTASVVTLNNQPVPVQVAKQTSYLRSSQTTITANVGSTTTLDPGMVTSGFNMTILPHVLNNGTVMLQFSTDMSSLRRIRTVSSNSSTIETPELDTRNFLQRVAMKSNETLIISGFEQTDDNLENRGTGSPTNWLFGGGFKAQTEKEVIVILVTPVAMGSI